mmetsp:Transcript_88904/g.226224  ORF Transcript_88904/g.226224 Transcript_88904/m.226224 type:complete len:221 (+) Transcript_88904:522-1184(+)
MAVAAAGGDSQRPLRGSSKASSGVARGEATATAATESSVKRWPAPATSTRGEEAGLALAAATLPPSSSTGPASTESATSGASTAASRERNSSTIRRASSYLAPTVVSRKVLQTLLSSASRYFFASTLLASSEPPGICRTAKSSRPRGSPGAQSSSSWARACSIRAASCSSAPFSGSLRPMQMALKLFELSRRKRARRLWAPAARNVQTAAATMALAERPV